MDAAVLNLKNTALTAAQQNAAGVAAKGDIQSNSDIFLGMIKQISRENVGRQNGLEGTLVSQTRNTASIAKTKTSQKQTTSKTDKTSVSGNDKTAPAAKETDKTENAAPARDTATNTVKTDKTETKPVKSDKPQTDGQKIPVDAKDSAVTEDTVFVPTETLPLQANGEEMLIVSDTVVEDVVADVNADDTGVQDKIVRSAGLVGSIAVIAQQIIAQTAPQNIDTPVDTPVDTATDIAPVDMTAAQVPGEIAPEQTTQATDATNVPEEFSAVLNAATTQKSNGKDTADTLTAETGIPTEDFADKNVSAQTETVVENPYKTEKNHRNADATAQKQATEIAAALPEDAHVDIRVETTTQAAVHTETVKKTEPETEETASVKENVTQNTPAAKEVRQTPHYEIASAAKAEQEASQNGNNAQQNTDASRNAVNILQNAGTTASSSDTQSFANALKSSTAIDGVTGAQTAGKADAAALFGAQSPALKGKAEGAAQTAQTTAAANVPTNDLVDQIKVNIAKAAQTGTQKVNITLKPKELGNIQVTLEIADDGDLKATIIASRASTLELLQKDSSGLQKALSDAGFKMNENSLNFSYRGEQQQNAQSFADGHAGSHNRSGNNAAFAPVNDNSAANADDALTEAVIASGWSSRHSLNIRI